LGSLAIEFSICAKRKRKPKSWVILLFNPIFADVSSWICQYNGSFVV